VSARQYSTGGPILADVHIVESHLKGHDEFGKGRTMRLIGASPL